MYPILPFSVAFSVALASAGALVKPGVARAALDIRQVSGPSIPGGGYGDCGDVCEKWQDVIAGCGNSTTASSDLLACYCSTDYITTMTACYDCLVPLVQAAGTDPNFQNEAQTAINDMEDACAQGGNPVPSQTIVPNSGAGATPSGGASPTPGSPTGSPASSGGSPAASGSGGAAPSPSKPSGPSSGGSVNGAMPIAVPCALAMGLVGAALVALGA